jgi:hypothetical protein
MDTPATTADTTPARDATLNPCYTHRVYDFPWEQECVKCGARLTLRPVDSKWGCGNLCCTRFLIPISEGVGA